MRLSLALAVLLLAAPASAFGSAGGAAYPTPVGNFTSVPTPNTVSSRADS